MRRRKSVVTIGMFDGVHVGHQRLIRATVRLAKRLRAAGVVLTFDPDPQCVLDPRHVQPRLMPLARRVELMESLGVDAVRVIRFTRRFAGVSAEEFIQRILLKELAAAGVVVGRNFTFGRGRRGTLSLLRRAGRRAHLRIVVVRPVTRAGAVVSSSRVRRLVQEGRVEQAGRLLGRPAQLYGTVVRGEGRARRLGFPTANIRLEPGMVRPPHGVYQVQLAHAGRHYPGLMNLGVRPTFSRTSTRNGQAPAVCEVHLPDFQGNLYGAAVTVDVLTWLRPERRFSSAAALVEQIRRDLRRALHSSSVRL